MKYYFHGSKENLKMSLWQAAALFLAKPAVFCLGQYLPEGPTAPFCFKELKV